MDIRVTVEGMDEVIQKLNEIEAHLRQQTGSEELGDRESDNAINSECVNRWVRKL